MVVGHLGTIIWNRGAEKRRHPLAATPAQLEAGTEFRAQDQVIEKVETFKYLESILSFDNSD